VEGKRKGKRRFSSNATESVFADAAGGSGLTTPRLNAAAAPSTVMQPSRAPTEAATTRTWPSKAAAAVTPKPIAITTSDATGDKGRRLNKKTDPHGHVQAKVSKQSSLERFASKGTGMSAVEFLKSKTVLKECCNDLAKLVGSPLAPKGLVGELKKREAQLKANKLEAGPDTALVIDEIGVLHSDITKLASGVDGSTKTTIPAQLSQVEEFTSRAKAVEEKAKEVLDALDYMLSEAAQAKRKTNLNQRYLVNKVVQQCVAGGFGAKFAKLVAQSIYDNVGSPDTMYDA
jgi:hypothetical protein